ncbi:MAG: FIST C-terminal domain-containing protein [Sandaracinaceae bacterium]|nr:FIST C-terminal domain-containing protein [Sandaracinaceae bacterium]
MSRLPATGHERVPDPTVDGFVRAATRLVARLGAGGQLLVLVAEDDAPDLTALVAALAAQATVPFFGGVFPAVIEGTRQHARGGLVVWLPASGAPRVVSGLDRDTIQIPAMAGRQGGATALVLVDGLARSLASFLEALYDRLGNTVAYWGGGAGSLRSGPRPCVFTEAGVFQDAAIVALVPAAASLGVRHGWTKLVGPLVATRTSGNEIQELNWERALDVYRAAVAADCGREITEEGFFEVAKGYPFGLQKQGAEDVVRDPIAVGPAGSLRCVGDVPENAVLSILKGVPEQLVAAAGAAAAAARAVGAPSRLSLVADCVSRAIFLEDRFAEELEAMDAARGDGASQIGMLTLGEISSQGNGYLELFNKTAVVASVPTDEHVVTGSE